MGRFIYLAGADGTGKTTQVRLIAEELKNRGIPYRNLRLRRPLLFSLPLLPYARWCGYSWYEDHDGIRHGYWDFRDSWLLREIFPWLFLLDAALAALLHVYLPLCLGCTIVCERFVLDMLVDLSVALADPSLHRNLLGRLFLQLLPRSARIVILDLDASAIRRRRPELHFDKRLDARLEAYQRLASDLSLPRTSTAGPLEQTFAQLQALLGGTL